MGQQVMTGKMGESIVGSCGRSALRAQEQKEAKETQGFDDLGTSSRSKISRAHSQAVQTIQEERKRGWKSCKGVMK